VPNDTQGGSNMKTESEGMTVRLRRDSLQGIPNCLLNAVQILLDAAESRARIEYLIREVPQAVKEILEKRCAAAKKEAEEKGRSTSA